MNREQVREAVNTALVLAENVIGSMSHHEGPYVEPSDALKAIALAKELMALDKPVSAPLLPSIDEIRDAIDPDHGTHPDRKETVPAEWVGIAAGCVHDMLTERAIAALDKPVTVTREELLRHLIEAPRPFTGDGLIQKANAVADYLTAQGVNVEVNE